MELIRTVRLDRMPTSLLNNLDARDAAVWLLAPFVVEAGAAAAADLLRLPWQFGLSESADPQFLEELAKSESPSDPLVRRRGFLQLVDTNPAEFVLPPRSLPIYLLNGRDTDARPGGLVAMTRRLTMLDTLRRSQVKHLIIAAGRAEVLPDELAELWREGLRTVVTVVTDSPAMATNVESWRNGRPFGTTTAYVSITAAAFCRELVSLYLDGRSGERLVLRVRDIHGEPNNVDITGIDDPEHPLFRNYEILLNGDLRYLQPEDLQKGEAEAFFRDAAASWRPYAAGIPWQRDEAAWQRLRSRLRRLDRDGSQAGRITYINAESGSGGTTLMRMLAWTAAQEGYPTLVAKSAPFVPKSLEIQQFMLRVIEADRKSRSGLENDRLYEAPWLIAFDHMHWEGHAGDLRHFLAEFERSGRSVCILIVTGPYIQLDFDGRYFLPLANLSHQIQADEAIALGKHLNRFLAPHGSTRTDGEWRSFYNATAVQAERGITAFWIALSFWLQRQFDLSETVQAWIYRQFKGEHLPTDIRDSIFDIASLSSERQPLPETMLPPTTDWPVSEKLEDIRKDVPALGLARISRDSERYWAMAHDVIGRFLLTALFYDRSGRDEAGFEDALNPEHLRFLVLRRLSRLPALGHAANRAIAEEFAISIFKVDPDNGHANFAPFWREVLTALDEMPKSLRTSSRSFLHHSAISRRRIAKLTDMFPMDNNERVDLLERAIRDMRYALENIPATSNSETDLNLYNSLAHAYQDLAETEIARGAKAKRIIDLRAQAQDATLRAYRANPDNSFVIETYARNLIAEAKIYPEKVIENALEALNIVYAAMERDKSGQRRFNLGRLADNALTLLLEASGQHKQIIETGTETEALVNAITALAANAQRFEGMDIADFPQENRLRAEELLSVPILQGNPQAVRLRYALRCLDKPRDFRGQLELLEPLQDSGTVFSPQMRLELALLLQQCDRHHEADRLFRELRRLWKEGEHYVEVPERLRWLITLDGRAQRQVTARVVRGEDYRSFAKVHELQDVEVPFRPQEFGQQQLKPGTEIRGFISFGHNGPFLRPTTAVQI